MIRIIFLLVVLGAGLFVGTQFAGQQGYVLISIANKTLEMSVTTLVLIIIALLAALFFIETIIKKILHTTSSTWNWFSVRKMRHSRRYTNEAIIKLIEGDWKTAEKKVTRWAKHHDTPLLCYLVASEAAQGLGDTKKRDHYLSLASKEDNSTLAVELTRAKQHISEESYGEAFDTLTALRIDHPNNNVILNLLKRTYLQLQQWQPLLDLLPQLKKQKQISDTEYAHLTEQSQCGLLVDIAEQEGSNGVIAHWDKLDRKVKQNANVVHCCIQQLALRNADNEAFTLLKESLKKNPSPQLYTLIPELKLADLHPATVLLENEVRRHSDNAEANSALAQLYLRQEKYADAEQYFQQALALRASVTDYTHLATTLELQNKPEQAQEASGKALALVNS